MLWGDGSPTREFLYVDDCAEGFVLAAERYDGAEPVNLGTGVEISIRELAELDRRADRLHGRDRLGHVDAERPAAPRSSTRRAREELFGFRAQTQLRDGLERTVAGTARRRPRMQWAESLVERGDGVPPLFALIGLVVLQLVVLAGLAHGQGWSYSTGDAALGALLVTAELVLVCAVGCVIGGRLVALVAALVGSSRRPC